VTTLHDVGSSLSELAARIASVDAVSFDVFDTLFVRPLVRPEDAFDLLGERFAIPEFRAIREKAQREAFRRMQEAGRGEITLDGIYACMPPLSVSADQLRDAELELELELTQPNPELLALFNETAARMPVVITTDTYMPRSFFERLFDRHGIGRVPMFVSAERDATKRDSGALFQLLTAELGLPAARVLHVGDNLRADVEQAGNRGLSAFHYRSSRRVEPNAPSASASLAAALVKVHVEPTPVDSFYGFGFRYGGPAAVGFLDWIAQQAREDRVDLLLFISRDGYVLERLAAGNGISGLPRSEYFPGSRVAFTLAATNEHNFASQIDFMLSGAHGLAAREVLERIGVPPPAESVLADLSLGGEVVLDDASIPRLAQLLYGYRGEILKVCRRNATGLLNLLLAHGVKPGMRLGMVDVGWNGTTQDALRQALAPLFDVTLWGYYLCLVDSPECRRRQTSMNMRAMFSKDNLPDDVLRQIYAKRVAVELLFSAPHDAVIGYETIADRSVRPIEDPGRGGSVGDLAAVVREILRGVEDFSAGFRNVCKRIDHRPDPLEVARTLLALVGPAAAPTLSILAGIGNFDAWGSSRRRHLSIRDYQ
jgi:FMN phosphatase YigB (HAD superfamily)